MSKVKGGGKERITCPLYGTVRGKKSVDGRVECAKCDHEQKKECSK